MRMSPWAEYGVVTVEAAASASTSGARASTSSALARLIVESGMPHADWWAGLWIGAPEAALTV